MPGTLVDGYALVTRRSDQGIGDVWLAERPHKVDERVLVKFIAPVPADKPVAPVAFTDYLRRLGGLSSPGLVNVRRGGVHEGWLYLIVEYVEARSLDDWLAGHREAGLRSNASVVFALFDSLCSTLQSAHRQGIAHRAVSPRSVLLRPLSPGTYHVWMMDFELAPWLREASLTTAIEAPSSDYDAPEVAASRAHEGPRADVFALASILVEMLTLTVRVAPPSREPLGRTVPTQYAQLVEQLKRLRDDVHEDFWKSLATMLHPDPTKRPEGASSLRAKVRSAAQNAGLWRDVPDAIAEPPAPSAVQTRAIDTTPAHKPSGTAPEGWLHSERVSVPASLIAEIRAEASVKPAPPAGAAVSATPMPTPTPAKPGLAQVSPPLDEPRSTVVRSATVAPHTTLTSARLGLGSRLGDASARLASRESAIPSPPGTVTLAHTTPTPALPSFDTGEPGEEHTTRASSDDLMMLQSEITPHGTAIGSDASSSTQTLTAARLASARAQAAADLATTSVPRSRPIAATTEVSTSLSHLLRAPDRDHENGVGSRRVDAVPAVVDAFDVEATLPPGVDMSATFSDTLRAPEPAADRTEQHIVLPPGVIAPGSYAAGLPAAMPVGMRTARNRAQDVAADQQVPTATLVAVRAPGNYDLVRPGPVMHTPPRPRFWAWWLTVGVGLIAVAIVTVAILSRL